MSPQQDSPESPEAIEAAANAQRAQLVDDVELLAARLAPRALSSTVRRSAQETVAAVRERTLTGAARLTACANPRRGDPLVHEAHGSAGVERTCCGRAVAAAAGLRPAPIRERLTRLLQDARDGEPGSLAVVTGAALVLAGVGAVAVLRTVRR